MTQIFHVTDRTRSYIAGMVQAAQVGDVVRIGPATRSLEQNALMWSLLSQISKSVVWHGQKLTKENWKDCLTASLKKQTVVPGIDGGFVVCGTSTSSMTKAELSELCELAIAFGTQQGVEFREFPAMEAA